MTAINANLSSSADTTKAVRNRGPSRKWCYGSQQKAKFDIAPALAIEMLHMPNPGGAVNSDVVKPSVNGKQILRRTPETWVIDFGQEEDVTKAAQYEIPFEYVKDHILPMRKDHRELRQRRLWWLHARPSPVYRAALAGGLRYIVTPAVSKHRVFVWGQPEILVDHQTVVFPTDDSTTLGILHSRLHQVWALAQGTQVRERTSGFRYTPKSCVETFPFPRPTDGQRKTIAEAAKELDHLRCQLLNPPEWTREEILDFPGSVDGPWRRYVVNSDSRGIGTVRYPRLIPKDAECAKQLAKRTLTNLYNERPTWLELAHRKLDEAVFAAYGWSPDLTDDQILEKLLALNLERASADAGLATSKI